MHGLRPSCARRAAALRLARTIAITLLVALTVLAVMVGLATPVVADEAELTYQAPVAGPIVEHFRAPLHPYGPGHRGIDYATEPGLPVRASAPGRVTFAGAVAGRLVVVIAHPDGLRTTYDGVASILVTAGQAVAGGEQIATGSLRLHFGVREGDTYLDPESVLAGPAPPEADRVVVRLVPTDGGPGRGAGPRPAAPGRARARWVGSAVERAGEGPAASDVQRAGERRLPAASGAARQGAVSSATLGARSFRAGPIHAQPAHPRSPFGVRAGRGQPRGRSSPPWRRSSPCASCWKRVSISGTRPGAGIRR